MFDELSTHHGVVRVQVVRDLHAKRWVWNTKHDNQMGMHNHPTHADEERGSSITACDA